MYPKSSDAIITAIIYKSFNNLLFEINNFPGGAKTIDKHGKAA